VTLNGGGGATYIWDNNVTDGVPFLPTSSALYTVIGTDTAGCSNTDQIQVNVIPAPIVDAGPDQTVCEGEQVTLAATGANGYNWDNNVSNNSPFIPSATTTYTVVGVDGNNCQGTDMVTVTVNETTSSTIDTSGLDQIVINGEIYNTSGTFMQTVLNANGCDSIITINISLGFTSLSENSNLIINYFPNPVKDVLNINLNSQENLVLTIYSVDGRLVQTMNLSSVQQQIDIRDLAAGEYIADLKNSSGITNQFMFIKE